MNSILLSLLMLLCLIIQSECGCYIDRTRCTPKAALDTGILWKSCTEYCQKCKGLPKGNCVRVHSKECNGGFQCQCVGFPQPKSKKLLDIMTCKLGL